MLFPGLLDRLNKNTAVAIKADRTTIVFTGIYIVGYTGSTFRSQSVPLARGALRHVRF